MSTRRRFLSQTAPLTLVPWLGACGGSDRSSNVALDTPRVGVDPGAVRFGFEHGVASGDPLPDAVILWTRVTPLLDPSVDAGVSADGEERLIDAGPVAVEWRVARDAAMTDLLLAGQAETNADLDYTLKVDARGLSSGTSYFYQFSVASAVSPVGRTRTLPEGHVERWRVAVTSCANYPQGFFHAYRKIAERSDLDLVLYLGDYIYEYANRSFGDGEPLGRVPEPNREILTLGDYRRRYAQYKRDPDLQEVHRLHPAVAVWDDHELADNAYRGGAKNHTEGAEGAWDERKQVAVRAFHEWMPIRAPDPAAPIRIYRSFAVGDLTDLIMLDTRLIGRDPSPLDVCDPAVVNDPDRQLLGTEQESWFFGELARSAARGARWRLVGQQVAFAPLRNLPPDGACLGSSDKWSAFAGSRSRVFDAIESGAIGNVVILTGDAHSSWGNDLPRDPFDPAAYDPETGRGSLAVELIVPGVTSPGIPDPAEAARSDQLYRATHPHIRYIEQYSQGYLLVTLTHAQAHAEWYYVSPVREPAALERSGGAVATQSGQNHLTLAPGSDAI